MNKGNQALSAAWLAMLNRAFPATRIRLIERRPRHLCQYTLRQFAAERDPFAAFDALATKLAKLAPGPDTLADSFGSAKITLDETIPAPGRFTEVRKFINLRGLAARAGLYADEYRNRLAACQRARLVIVNPAGEFFPREPLAAFYHVLDAHVAQKLGRPTAIVNHTMDITDPTMRILIPRVYETLALVGFRDEKSIGAFKEMGGKTANVLVTPDLALTTEVATKPTRRNGTIAIAVNVPEAEANGYLDQWRTAIGVLRGKDFKIELVSNEMPAEIPFYEEMTRRYPEIKVAGGGFDHDRYCQLLGQYDFVITSRMHTGILAMIMGTPVIPVEGASFKMTGLFHELGFASPVIRPTANRDWVDKLAERAAALRGDGDRDAASRDTSTKIGTVRERVTSLLVPRLRAVADATVGAP
ncbi:MAG: polysaccharide pyruvyl transferase family protein [Kofleriaceae bacterium]